MWFTPSTTNKWQSGSEEDTNVHDEADKTPSPSRRGPDGEIYPIFQGQALAENSHTSRGEAQMERVRTMT